MVDERDVERIQRIVHRFEVSADVALAGAVATVRVFSADPSQLGGFLDEMTDRYHLDVHAEGVDPGPGEGPVDNLQLAVRRRKGLLAAFFEG